MHIWSRGGVTVRGHIWRCMADRLWWLCGQHLWHSVVFFVLLMPHKQNKQKRRHYTLMVHYTHAKCLKSLNLPFSFSAPSLPQLPQQPNAMCYHITFSGKSRFVLFSSQALSVCKRWLSKKKHSFIYLSQLWFYQLKVCFPLQKHNT